MHGLPAHELFSPITVPRELGQRIARGYSKWYADQERKYPCVRNKANIYVDEG